MAKTLLQSSVGAGWTVNDGVTQFAPVGNCRLAFLGTEAQAQIRYRFAGTISNLHVRIAANTLTNSATITLRVNGADTALVATVTAGSTGEFVDDADSVVIASTDLLSYEITSAAGGTSITVSSVSVTMDADTDRSVVVGGTPSASISAASATRFATIVTDDLTAGNEDGVPMKILQDCTARNAFLFISANARSTATVWTLRKNGADTAITISVGAGATGIFEDASNSVSLVDGDIINWQIVTGTGSGTLTARTWSLQIDSVDQFQVFAGSNADVSGDTGEFSAVGGLLGAAADETIRKVNMREAVPVSKVAFYARTNSGIVTATVRKNGADTPLAATSPSTVTGWHEASGSVDFADGDDLTVGWTANAANSLRSLTLLIGAAAVDDEMPPLFRRKSPSNNPY